MRRVTFFLPWLAVAAAIAVMSTAALSLAGSSPPQEAPEIEDTAPLIAAEEPLLVPDVRRQPYVFAKGILEDAGFAWRVKGGAKGFPANLVTKQKPAAGTLLRDTGAPTIVLTLERNIDYQQRGIAKNSAPYKGTKNVRWDDPAAMEKPPDAMEKSPDAIEKPPDAMEKPPEAVEAPPDPAPAPPPSPVDPPVGSTEETARPAAFIAPGAPPEPLDEIPLPERADNLASKLAGAAQTDELVEHWLYQHEWIVTGALFGWHAGDEALVTLIAIDDDLQQRWGIGAKSAEVARNALDDVRAEIAEAAQGP